MEEINLSKEDIKSLNKIINNKENQYSNKTIKKANAIKLCNEGKNYNEIINETGFSIRTLQYLFKNFKLNKFAALYYPNYPKSKLCDAKNSNDDYISDYFKEKEDRPKTYKDATKIIRREFHVSLSESAVRRYLQKIKIFTEKSKKNFKVK